MRLRASICRFAALLRMGLIALSLIGLPVAFAQDTYLTGTMTNITSTPSGLMIILDAGVPTNCTGTPYGWMLIPESNKTMIATALSMWLSGQRKVTVYTNQFNSGQGACVINQFDPS